jgi:hypothetical protein
VKRTPRGAEIRFQVDPRDVPATKAARRLHLTEAEFEKKKVELFERGFPRPDPTTGMYDLVKIDQWMDGRDASTGGPRLRNAQEVVRERLARL